MLECKGLMSVKGYGLKITEKVRGAFESEQTEILHFIFYQFRVSAEVFMINFGYSFSEAYFSPKIKETTFELYDYL